MTSPLPQLDGALVIHKEQGLTSFGVLETLQKNLRAAYGIKRSELPKTGHGGTLDPFATGVLPVCVGRAVKLSRYFLEAPKEYRGIIRFGQTTVPGDPTSEVTERSEKIPTSLEELSATARALTLQPYLQTPPMHSAKKVDGKPLYELARQGKEIEREPKLCHLYEFEITEYQAPLARFRVKVSSGTYIRVLAQDLGRMLGTVAMLDQLERTQAAWMRIENSLKVGELEHPWSSSPAWIPFDRLLDGFARVQASAEEARAIENGRQEVLISLVSRSEAPRPGQPEGLVAIYAPGQKLLAVTRRTQQGWQLERVLSRDSS
jgi:tRNA pseudouridine55 synthase